MAHPSTSAFFEPRLNAQKLGVMHVISDLHTGGAQSMLYRLLSHAAREDFALSIVGMTEEGVIGRRIASLGVPVSYLNMKRGIPNPAGLWRLVKLIRQQRPIILQSWLYHADLMCLIAGKLAGVPIIVWNVRQSGMDMRHYSRLSRLVVRLLARLSRLPHGVIINSKAGQAAHADLGYRPRQWIYLPNGFDLDVFRPDLKARSRVRDALRLPEQARLIGLFARFDPMKDHEMFLRAALHFLDQGSEAHFVLAGPGVDPTNESLTRWISDGAAGTHIHLLGDREDIPDLLPALDIYTMSSAFGEGFPNAIGEAMACGIPCVATDVGDAALIIGDAGYIVPPRDFLAMAEAWKRMLLLDSAAYGRLSIAARERIAQHFNINSVARAYGDLYRKLAGDWNHPRVPRL